MSGHNITSVKGSRILAATALVGLSAAGIAYTGINGRARSEAELARWDAAEAIPTVTTVSPQRGGTSQEVVLPGTIQAYNTAAIHPRATGYIKSWDVDIGAHVKAGQVLATIESPDLDQQLEQARAELASAEANAKLAAATAERWADLVKTDIVSHQAADEKTFDASSKAAVVQSARANVARLESLSSFETVKAPFDGIVTARNVDIGDLVGNGGTAGKPLFEVADIHRARIYVRVPQAFLGEISPGLSATLDLPQYPDHPFPATLVSTANAVSEDTRTALVELQADNGDDKLWPGTFAEVHMQVPADPGRLQVPSSALVFGRKGMRVAVVGADDRIAMRAVTLGRNLGPMVEVRGGLAASDHVVDHPAETLATGDKVEVATTDGDAATKTAQAAVASPRTTDASR